MFLHHIVTVLLLAFSWTCNFHRIGALVMVIHDSADVPLDGAKIFSYLKMQRLSNAAFALLTISWIFTRIGLLPYRIIAYSSYYALWVVEMFPAYYIFNSLLCALQILHVIWTALILKIGYDGIYNNNMVSVGLFSIGFRSFGSYKSLEKFKGDDFKFSTFFKFSSQSSL